MNTLADKKLRPPLTPEIETTIKKLFWSTPGSKRIELSVNAIVEQTLNYGNMQDINALFMWIGIDRVAEIFFEQIKRERNGYHKRTRHYFITFFNRHVPRHS